MKHHTEESIQKRVAEIFFSDQQPYRDEGIAVNVLKDGTVRLEIFAMYDSPERNEDRLQAVERFFETPNVEIIGDISESGCETCDYGSRYGFVVRVWS